MYKYFLRVFFIFSMVCAYAQELPPDRWHKGFLILNTKDTLAGLIKYDLQNEVVQLQINDVLNAYTPQKVIAFYIIDAMTLKQRHFESVKYKNLSGFEIASFFEFETTFTNKTLISRENVVVNNVNSGYMNAGFISTYRSIVYEFYILNQKGEIEHLPNNKKAVLALLSDRSAQIQQFMKKNKVRLGTKRGLLQVMDYYNSLTNPNYIPKEQLNEETDHLSDE